MKAMLSGHTRCDDAKFEDTELALAISPCPKLEQSKDIGEFGEFARGRSRMERGPRTPWSTRAAFDDDDVTETLTLGWAIALAIAVAVVILSSGA